MYIERILLICSIHWQTWHCIMSVCAWLSIGCSHKQKKKQNDFEHMYYNTVPCVHISAFCIHERYRVVYTTYQWVNTAKADSNFTYSIIYIIIIIIILVFYTVKPQLAFKVLEKLNQSLTRDRYTSRMNWECLK